MTVWWLPAEEFVRVRRLWPEFDAEWAGGDFSSYCLRHEGILRDLTPLAERFAIARVTVDAYLSWCDSEELVPWVEDHLTRYAAEAESISIDWPPRAEAPCWCGSDRRYADCCGIPISVTPLRAQWLSGLIHEFTAKQTWHATRAFVLRHPELREDAAAEVLTRLRVRYAHNSASADTLDGVRRLLDRCREAGTEVAFDEQLKWKVADTEEVPELLGRAVREVEHAQRLAEASPTEDTLGAVVSAWQRQAETADLLGRPVGERSTSWLGLAVACVRRGAVTNSFEDAVAATEAMGRVIEQLSPDSPERLGRTTEHAQLYRFMRLRAETDESLDRVVDALRQDLDACPEPFKAPYLAPLAEALQDRFERWGSLTDLDRQIESYQTLLRLNGPEDELHLLHANRLGLALRQRSLLRSNLHDLDEAVHVLEAASRRSTRASTEALGLVTNLGLCLRLRYEHMGRTSDLNNAVSAHRNVLALCSEDSEYRPYGLNNLGVVHSTRYRRLGDIADLERSIQLLRESVARTSEGDPVLWERLHNLAGALVAQAIERPTEKSLASALDTVHRVAACAPSGTVHRFLIPGWQSSLLSRRYLLRGQISDLDSAITFGEQALSVLPAGAGERGRLVDDLGHSLLARFERQGVRTDLERALELFEFALAVPRARWPGLPAQLRGLARALTLAEQNERATEIYRLASSDPDRGDLRSRFAAACDWAVRAAANGDGEHTAEAARHASVSARRITQIWSEGGTESAHKFGHLIQMAATVREALAGSLYEGPAIGEFAAVHALFSDAGRGGLPAAADPGLSERLRQLERSSLDSAGSANASAALRAAWAALDRASVTASPGKES
ncbi:hypothetical protein AS594_06540 [Streptomyces agglomeratus]|uniref:SEC-C domain-containing protein n=1 Tax=Streptomyces agglomeratus TaxID=285458 RepID=A0A1E5P3S7_9ACTN|nr:hypothetical protein AS594_06540 [Streptomyces agglomeratus]OEJ54293.1 hypothetical protein BGK72_29350 [Streptomyces agglomeratus]